jgi:hypothetical protein
MQRRCHADRIAVVSGKQAVPKAAAKHTPHPVVI